MISKTQTYHHLERIVASKLFRSSSTNKKLLRYLVDESLKGNIPREMDIALDFFGKNTNYNPADDSLVRSHIYALRQKLEKFYLTEGKSDAIRFVIPKGRYEVVFIDAPVPPAPPKVRRSVAVWCGALIIALVVLISLHFLHDHNVRNAIQATSPISVKNPIWHDFIDSEKPILLVLGDYFIFWEKKKYTQGDRKIRDGAINSREDLEQFVKENPEQADVVRMENQGSYVTPEIMFGMASIIPYFSIHGQKTDFERSSFIDAQDLQHYNTIFIGPYKTLYQYEQFVQKLKLRFQIYPHQILIGDDESMPYMNLRLPDESQYRKDFALVARVPGQNQSKHLIIAFFSPGSATKILQPLMSDEHIALILDEFIGNDSFPPYFEALYEISDFQDKIMSTLTHFFPIDQQEFKLAAASTP
jgi:hypothetical protein